MTFLYYIAAYLLGALSFGAFMLYLLVKLHPKATPPTKFHRRWSDRTVCEAAPPLEREDAGIQYRFMGTTGLEE